MAAGMCPERLQRVTALTRGYVDSGRMPCADVLVARHNKLLLRDTYGDLNVESRTPLPEDALFRIYSMTKPLTCIAGMICYERGFFAMDDPVGLHLPEFANLSVLVGGGKPPPGPEEASELMATPLPENCPLTIGHLFTHTNGLSRAPGGPAPTSLAESVQQVAASPLLFLPGTQWKYSGGHDVVARLVEVWTGCSYEEFLRSEVLKPLRMHGTTFRVPLAQRHRLVTPYSYTQTAGNAVAPGLLFETTTQDVYAEGDSEDRVCVGAVTNTAGFPAPSGGLVSTMADYSKFAHMLLNGGELEGGGRLLGRKTVQQIATNYLPIAAGCQAPDGSPWLRTPDCGVLGAASDLPTPGHSNTNGGPGIGFGVGGMAVVSDTSLVPYPCSDGEIYWVGAASTHFWVDRAEGLVVIFFSQLLPWTQYNYMRELRIAVSQALIDDDCGRALTLSATVSSPGPQPRL